MLQPNAVPSSIKLPQPLRERVKSLAEARNQSAHAVMLRAIESYVTREEKREALRQDAIAAWEEFQRTNLHLTGDEVRSWIDQIRQGKKASLPKCHV